MLLAIPPDVRIVLHERSIEKVSADAVATEGPVRAELLPSKNELLIEAAGKGIAHVFLFDRRAMRVIEVAVEVPLPEPGPEPTCPTVKDAACYEQFRKHPLPHMVFELPGLQAEAKAAQELLDRASIRVTVGISAWGIKLKGVKDDAEKRKALMTIWPAILGPMRVDD